VDSNSNPSYIEIYDNALSSTDCALLRSLFEELPHTCGKTTEGVQENIKKSIELDSTRFSDDSDFSKIIAKGLLPCIDKYYAKYKGLYDIWKWRYDDIYTAKKFESEDDGYKSWHTEHVIGAPYRIFVWSFYLNNAQSGTDFRHYPTVDAKEGRCVIFPAHWTHVHRSALNKDLKYYVSGWVSYRIDGEGKFCHYCHKPIDDE